MGALVLMGGLAGCGADSDGTPVAEGEASVTPAAFDVTAATLTDELFCDRVDMSLVATALGMSADQVKLRQARGIGEKFEGPVEEGGPATSKVNSCGYGSSTRQFIVTVDPDSSARAVRKTIDFYAVLGQKGYSSERCTSEEDPSFGDPAAVATCHGSGASRRASVVVTGLVGGSKFFCTAILNSGSTSRLQEPTIEACRSTLEAIAGGTAS